MSLKTAEEIFNKFDNAPDCTTDTTDQAIDSHLKIFEVAKENVDRAQVKQKEQYDLKHAKYDAYHCGSRSTFERPLTKEA